MLCDARLCDRYLNFSLIFLWAFLEDPLGGKGARPPPSQINLPVPHVDTLESSIREELIALGLFETQEKKSEGGDEIQEELQKKQSELKAVCEYNQQQRQSRKGRRKRRTLTELCCGELETQLHLSLSSPCRTVTDRGGRGEPIPSGSSQLCCGELEHNSTINLIAPACDNMTVHLN